MEDLGIQRERRIQLAVHFLVGTRVRYYPVSFADGWKIDTESNCIVIGKGQPRTMIPIGNIEHWVIEEYYIEK